MSARLLMRRVRVMSAMAALVLLASVIASPRAFGGAVKLFEPVPLTSVGAVGEVHAALAFAHAQVTLICPPGPSAILSSNSDGTGPIVVDNFVTMDGLNVCPFVVQRGTHDCFQALHGGSYDAARAYTGVPPIDISSRLSPGSYAVNFALNDHGGLLASSEIWLVTNCFVWSQR